MKKIPFIIQSSVFIGLSQQMFFLIIPLIVLNSGLSDRLMSVVRSMEYVPNVLFAVLIGILVHDLSAKRSLFLSSALILTSSILLFITQILSNNTAVLLVASLLFATGVYAFSNARNVFIKEKYDSNQLLSLNARVGFFGTFDCWCLIHI